MEVSEASPSVDRSPAPAPVRSRYDVTPAERVLDVTSTRSADTITTLPSIYSTSPAINHQTGSQSTLLAEIEPQQRDESIISPGDASQWLQMYFHHCWNLTKVIFRLSHPVWISG